MSFVRYLGFLATRSMSLVRMSETSTSAFSLDSRSCATKLAAPRCQHENQPADDAPHKRAEYENERFRLYPQNGACLNELVLESSYIRALHDRTLRLLERLKGSIRHLQCALRNLIRIQKNPSQQDHVIFQNIRPKNRISCRIPTTSAKRAPSRSCWGRNSAEIRNCAMCAFHA
jgi:hypothetical protein